MLLILGRERERERNINVREKHQSVASRMCPHRGSNSSLYMRSDQNPTYSLLAYRMMLQPAELPGQGSSLSFTDHPTFLTSNYNLGNAAPQGALLPWKDLGLKTVQHPRRQLCRSSGCDSRGQLSLWGETTSQVQFQNHKLSAHIPMWR